MRFFIASIILAISCPAMVGCVSLVKTAVQAPVKVVSKSADLLTTSRAEADENRGRDLRQQDQRIGALLRQRDQSAIRCRNGNPAACDQLAKYEAAIAEARQQPFQ